MTENFDKTINIHTNHSSFGGIIYPSDFETEYYSENGRNIASRIASDWIFDEECRKNEIARERKRKEKNNAETNI